MERKSLQHSKAFMHDIEPWYRWRNHYIASNDAQSPFYLRTYSEFEYTHQIYNYLIHPQWDTIGSETLYVKILYANYERGMCIIELIGEWNDAIANDIATLRSELVDRLAEEGISKYIFLGENLLNYHGDEDDYYEEWHEEVQDEGGWITFINFREHVIEEMEETNLHFYINLGDSFNEVPWRKFQPEQLLTLVEKLVENYTPKLLR